MREEIIGDCRLILSDCMDVLPTLGKVDAVVTDPPYGIKEANGFGGFGGFRGFGAPIARKEYTGDWDDLRPSKSVFDAMGNAADLHIIWGGNYFTDYLPVSGKWLFWDKCQTMPTYSDGEMAWTSLSGVSVKRIVYNNNGLQAKEKERVHPTQKPVGVMTWCINQLPNAAQTILDPFMGSGTTGVACVKMGRKFIGIEREPEYFEIACKRIREAYAQPDMFVQPPEKLIQADLL
jgi:DNA modification methylase